MAEIVGVHGIQGWVKLKIFSDTPESLLDYASLHDPDKNRDLRIQEITQHGNIWLAKIEGIADRTTAEKMRGTKLFLPRVALPEIKQDNTYYHADLIGLTAQYPDGKVMGKVIAVTNFGAGDLLDIKPPKGNSFYVPFRNEIVPEVNLTEKTVTIDPPPGLLD